MSTPLLSLQNVGVGYRRISPLRRSSVFWALKDISFDLKPGETLGVVGRNGAGKSTLLRLLAGIIQPDRGRIIRSTQHTLLLSLQAGFMLDLTGRENCILSGILLGMSRKRVKERMGWIFEFAELEDYMDQPVKTYSTGMRARLGFAIACQAEPEVLLIDEVLGVGDAKFREKSQNVMKSYMNSHRTVVLVSHSEHAISQFCQRAVWIHNGVTEIEGDVEKVLGAYQKSIR